MAALPILRSPAPFSPAWFQAVVAAALAVAASPVHAIIVYRDPGRLTELPVLPGGVQPGWQYVGTTEGYGGVPIGPRAWVTATHVTNTSSRSFWYANAGATSPIQYFGTRAAVEGDLAVMVLDAGQPDFQEWAPVWPGSSPPPAGQEVYLYGYGTLRDGEVTNDVPAAGTRKGWYWGAGDSALSYGTNQIASLASVFGSTQFRMTFSQPMGLAGPPDTEGIFSVGDSGGGVFAFNSATSRWELVGINSAVELVSATPGGPPLYAALYDARGFYTDTSLITGDTNVPLSSFAIALPYYDSFLAPYLAPVPEPSTAALAMVAAVIVSARSTGGRRARAGDRNGRWPRS